MYGEKIALIRELRGFTQEHMASELGIKQNSYSRIETNQTKLSAEMLEKIARVLGVSAMDIISHSPAIVNFESNQGHQGHQGNVQNFYASQQEFFEKMIASKDLEIQQLKEIIAGLLEDKETMMSFFKK